MVNSYNFYLKRSTLQGQERVIDTLSARRHEPQTTNQ